MWNNARLLVGGLLSWGYPLCPIRIHPMQLKDAKLGYSWAVSRHCFRENNCQRHIHLTTHRQVVMRYCPFS